MLLTLIVIGSQALCVVGVYLYCVISDYMERKVVERKAAEQPEPEPEPKVRQVRPWYFYNDEDTRS